LPLENAVRHGRVDAARLLLARGNAAPGLLEQVALKGQANMVDLLVATGADVNARFASGATPLHDAALKGRNEVVRLLLAKGALADGRDSRGATPLNDAALSGQAETVRILLAHGAEIDARETETGNTALYVAASFGRAGVVAALLDAGADPNVCNKDGVSPLRAALANGNGETAYRIRASGGVEAYIISVNLVPMGHPQARARAPGYKLTVDDDAVRYAKSI
jgi:ankyrin repeat protein